MIDRSILYLQPWKDGYKQTCKLLEQEERRAMSTKTLQFQIGDDDKKNDLSTDDIFSIIDSISESLPYLESVIITTQQQNNNSTTTNNNRTSSLLPIPAMTSLLTNEELNTKLKSIQVIGVSFHNASELEMNGFIEALRIHPTLHGVVIKECTFGQAKYLEVLRSTLQNNNEKQLKTLDLFENEIIVESCWNNVGGSCIIL